MPAAATNIDIFQRLFGWIARKFSDSKGAKPVQDLAFFVPALFVARTVFPALPAADAWDFSTVSALRQGIANRLKSVAAQTVPKSRKGPRRKAVLPAGKCIPKKATRDLKRYKQEAVQPVAAAWRRPASQPVSRPVNVVSLAARAPRARRVLSASSLERLAA
jgi:hypothetical protein